VDDYRRAAQRAKAAGFDGVWPAPRYLVHHLRETALSI
jgi:2,4-dienoyl-CoA reductase-like NADH-dependent reductase (Old Yellow Enzyme family)